MRLRGLKFFIYDVFTIFRLLARIDEARLGIHWRPIRIRRHGREHCPINNERYTGSLELNGVYALYYVAKLKSYTIVFFRDPCTVLEPRVYDLRGVTCLFSVTHGIFIRRQGGGREEVYTWHTDTQTSVFA
ncbi:hypothetical protein PUN28_000444 [Cardiocondyla obscurior]|uniref:Uncharacterized protein n=1 Tax=Cardiocondyla obscurior TaxID=286306 RepID=A0AAW2GZG9_9HYME